MGASDCAIVCTSVHHGNTRRLAEAMASILGAVVLEARPDALEVARTVPMLGLGSGVFFGSHHERLCAFAQSLPSNGSGRAFLFSTCGSGYEIPRMVGRDYHRKLRRILADKGYRIVGEFSCKGYDTYGPLRRLGGIAKGHPNASDFEKARRFALDVMSRNDGHPTRRP